VTGEEGKTNKCTPGRDAHPYTRAGTRKGLGPEKGWDQKRAGTGKGWHQKKAGTGKGWHQKRLAPEKGWYRKWLGTRKKLALEVLWHKKNAKG
jgi:hypothetical protein